HKNEKLDDYPAVAVDHALAQRYAEWAGGRLPSEAEWEFVARSRGREGYAFIWGPGPPPGMNDNRANMDAADTGLIKVGMRPEDQTEQHVMDLTGHVREWCRDPWPDQHFGVRGGSWFSDYQLFSVAARDSREATAQEPDLGFRIVLEWPPKATA